MSRPMKTPELVKVQTPQYSSDSEPWRVLIYNKDETFKDEVEGDIAKAMCEVLGLDQRGDKAYVEAYINDLGMFLAAPDSVTREDQGW